VVSDPAAIGKSLCTSRLKGRPQPVDERWVGIADPMPTQLERMLVAAAQDPAERPAFTLALLASEVYVLGSLDVPTVDGVAQPGTNAQLVNFSDDDSPFVPFFTSELTMHASLAARAGTKPNYLRLQCRELFELTKGARLVLDPDSPNGKKYLPAEIESLDIRRVLPDRERLWGEDGRYSTG
jgi:hypothetical protein